MRVTKVNESKKCTWVKYFEKYKVTLLIFVFLYESLFWSATFHTAVVTETREKERLKELLVIIKTVKIHMRERRTVETPTFHSN